MTTRSSCSAVGITSLWCGPAVRVAPRRNVQFCSGGGRVEVPQPLLAAVAEAEGGRALTRRERHLAGGEGRGERHGVRAGRRGGIGHGPFEVSADEERE